MSAYLSALKMLARRELSEAQVRQRLIRRGHPPEDVDAAIDRLAREHAIDDGRVADAIVRTQALGKSRGRARVQREIERAGIAPAVAREALARAADSFDQDALADAALHRRLHGRAIGDEREFRRLYRYLIAQGFDGERALAALERHRGPARD
jgi:regulatory protein